MMQSLQQAIFNNGWTTILFSVWKYCSITAKFKFIHAHTPSLPRCTYVIKVLGVKNT